MKKQKMAWLAIMGCTLYGAQAFAGRDGGNGGNTIALEFKDAAHVAIVKIISSAHGYPEVHSIDLEGLLSTVQVLVSQEPLYAMKGQVRQRSTAINYTQPDTVVINESEWKSIANNSIKQALAIHELLSLRQIESTGNYPVSSRYLENQGVHCGQDLCASPPVFFSAFSFQAAKDAFGAAELPKPNELQGSWLMIGSAETPDTSAENSFGLQYGYSELGKFSNNCIENQKYWASIGMPYSDNCSSDDRLQRQGLWFGQAQDSLGNTSWVVEEVLQSKAIPGPYQRGGKTQYTYTDQGACFAVNYEVLNDTAETPTSHFGYSCRWLNAQTRLLCAITYYFDSNCVKPEHAKHNGQIVGYQLLMPWAGWWWSRWLQ